MGPKEKKKKNLKKLKKKKKNILLAKQPRLVAVAIFPVENGTFENRMFENRTLKRSVFEWIRNSNVRNSSPNCTKLVWNSDPHCSEYWKGEFVIKIAACVPM